jgi:hypothetical protein
MTTPRPRSRQPKQLDAGIVQAVISSFALRLAAEDSSALDLFQREDPRRGDQAPDCSCTV